MMAFRLMRAGLLFLGLGAVPATAATGVTDDCTLEGVPLSGRVKIVESFPDFTVQRVNSFPDLKVKFVDSFADECGLWKKVDSLSDFTIQYVDSFPDLKIEIVDSFPGLP